MSPPDEAELDHDDIAEQLEQGELASLEAELNQLNEPNEDKLGVLAAHYVALYDLKKRVTRKCAAAYHELHAAMEEQGCSSIGVNGVAKVSTQVRGGIRVLEGLDPDTTLRNMEKAREWVEKYNPQGTSITQNILKQTLEAYLESAGADAPMPSFLEATEVETLSVRRI
jgi:hypothetical protein